MARYDYKCSACGNIFEVEHPMSEHPEISCPNCGEHCERVFEPSSISFKGSGFYNTDQKNAAPCGASTPCAGCDV